MRRAWRSAQRLHADARHPRRARARGGGLGRGARGSSSALRRLAAVLGANLLVEEGDDVAAVAARVARERGTTYVLLGAPSLRRGLGRLGEPLPLRLMRLAARRRRPHRRRPRR